MSELNGSGKCLYAPVLDSCYLLATVGDSPVLGSIVVLVSDIEASKRFWSEGVGFQIQSEDKNGVRLFWPGTLICKSLSLTLLATAETTEQPEFVDRVGTVLLSFVSTDIETDGGKIKCFTKGELSPLMEFEINNKRIAASMYLGPSNELIELIQIVR